MTLNSKKICICRKFPEYLSTRNYKKCPHCLDMGWNIYPINLEKYDGEFTKAVIWTDEPDGKTDIEHFEYDIWVEIVCECGDRVSFSEWGKEVCKCGRVYRLSGDVEKDDSHRGDFEYWKKEWDMYSED